MLIFVALLSFFVGLAYVEAPKMVIGQNSESVDIMDIIRKERKEEIRENVCCTVNPTKTIITSTSKVEYAAIAEKIERNHTCGFLYLSTCKTNDTIYRSQAFYNLIYHSKIVSLPCPRNKQICCRGYFYVAGHCISTEALLGLDNITDFDLDVLG